MCVSLELDDDWLHSQDPVESGVSFYVKVVVTQQSFCVCGVRGNYIPWLYPGKPHLGSCKRAYIFEEIKRDPITFPWGVSLTSSVFTNSRHALQSAYYS